MASWTHCHGFCILAMAMIAPITAEEGAKVDHSSWLPLRKTKEQITPEEWAGMKVLAERYPAPEEAPGVEKGVRAGRSRSYYSRYGGGLPRPETWREVTPEHLAKWEAPNLSALCDLPRIYSTDPTEEGRAKARELFLKQARMFIDREDANSAGGVTYMIRRVSFQKNTLAMKDVLKQAGLYDEFTRAWAMHKRFMLNEFPLENMDWSRDRVPVNWALVANMDDGPEKLYRLRLLQRATNISHSRLITPDGGGLHHRCDHISYGSYSFQRVLEVAVKAHGTPFQLSDGVYRNLKAYAWVHSLSSMGNEYPGNLGARATLHPQGIGTEGWLRELADMTDPPDRDLAAMYLAKFPGPDDEAVGETAKRYREVGIKPFDMNAHHSYNISAAAIHRRGDWLVTIDGCRQPFKGIELYTWPGTDRSFMPNSAFGSIMILKADTAADREKRNARRKALEAEHPGDSGAVERALSHLRPPRHGYTYEGWDHNHYAGVTAPVLPYDQLMTARRNEQVRNGSSFAGGTSLGGNGIWGMISARYGQEICRQSAFCFDSRVTVLTSDIHPLPVSRGRRKKNRPAGQPPSDEPVYPTHTTLFQFALDDHAEPIRVNGESIAKFPHQQRVELGQPIRLTDHKGNGYYVHAGDGDVLHVERKTQYSFNFLGGFREGAPQEVIRLRAANMSRPNMKKVLGWCKPIPGDFCTAYIEHDAKTAPSAAAFTLFVQGKPAEGNPPYEILRQDRIAHVLKDAPSKTTGYVVFEAHQDLGVGVLESVSRPSTVMLQEADDRALKCSVSSTDARSDAILLFGPKPGEPPHEPAPIVLKLKGAWTIERTERRDIACKRDGGVTIVTIPYRDDMPVGLALREVQ